MAQSKPKPIADPQPQVDGQELKDVDRDAVTEYPSSVLLDESKPYYVGTENAPEPFKPRAQVVESPGSGLTAEVHVVLDQAVPGEVYVPDEGRGFLSLPIHALAGAMSPEEQFAEAAESAVEPSSEDREQAAAEGRTAQEVAQARQND